MENCVERESYALTAGLALGLVCLKTLIRIEFFGSFFSFIFHSSFHYSIFMWLDLRTFRR